MSTVRGAENSWTLVGSSDGWISLQRETSVKCSKTLHTGQKMSPVL